MKIGDKEFWAFWEASSKQLDRKKARKLLSSLMNLAQMPGDLSGDLSENQQLLSRFAEDLPPHHRFWKELAAVVSLAFPKEDLSQSGSLEKKVHQFRYVISSQQAQYVREHYKRMGMTDAQALATYIREKGLLDFSVKHSSRLHNKVAFFKGKKRYPDGQESVNFKILLAQSHTEFILSSDGCFLNELDAEEVTEAGIVNGASFNYGRKSRHWELDVKPIRVHDPAFRSRLAKPFHNPNSLKKAPKRGDDFDRSYFHPSGLFAKDGQSLHHLVLAEGRKFRGLVGQHHLPQNWLKKTISRAKTYLATIKRYFFPKNKK